MTIAAIIFGTIGLACNLAAGWFIASALRNYLAKNYGKAMVELLFSIALGTLFDFTIK